MSVFVLLSWAFCLSTSILLGLIVLRYRYLLIKPSLIVLTLFHLRIQWAAAFRAETIEKLLPSPAPFLIMSQAFPLIGVVLAFFIAHRTAIGLATRLRKIQTDRLPLKIIITALLLVIFLISFLYLRQVPITQTGLYSIFTRPEAAAEARETSLKLISNPLIRYSYSFLINVFAPLLGAFLLLFWQQERRRKNYVLSLSAPLILVYLLLIVSLSGARTPAAALLLTIFLVLYIEKGLPLRFSYIVGAFVLIMTPPILLTILREGQIVNFTLYVQYFQQGLFQRIFVTPMEVGLYHVHYAQTQAFFGLAAIPKLAALIGIPAVNAANLIYSTYYHYALSTGIANTCYVFSYYSYFGLLSIIFSLCGLWLLDSALVVLKKIRSDSILLASLATLLISSMAFIAADYTIALVSNGFLLILFTSWILDRIFCPA